MINKFINQLNNIDPMPWNQAILLGIALGILMFLAICAPGG